MFLPSCGSGVSLQDSGLVRRGQAPKFTSFPQEKGTLRLLPYGTLLPLEEALKVFVE